MPMLRHPDNGELSGLPLTKIDRNLPKITGFALAGTGRSVALRRRVCFLRHDEIRETCNPLRALQMLQTPFGAARSEFAQSRAGISFVSSLDSAKS